MMSAQHSILARRNSIVRVLVSFFLLLAAGHHHPAAAGAVFSPFGSRIGVSGTQLRRGVGTRPVSWRRSSSHCCTRKSSTTSEINNLLDYDPAAEEECLGFLLEDDHGDDGMRKIEPCRAIGNTLLRGALLRIASDLSVSSKRPVSCELLSWSRRRTM
jgi:hypothetical protein